MPHRWPLTGRDSEVGVIQEVLGGGGAGVALLGSPGLGKTRLLYEGLAVAQAAGLRTASVTATASAASIALGAFAQLLPEQIAPGDKEPFPTKQNILRVAATALTERVGEADDAGAGHLPVLGVDDAHLLDPMSAALLHQVVLEGLMVVLVSVRTRVTPPDAVVALWKEELVRRIEVPPLASKEAADLLDAVLDGQVASSTSYRLWRATRGNPLLLRELVSAARQSGVLAPSGGVWRWHGDVPVSPELAETVETRLRGLSDSERQSIEVLAVAGHLRTSILLSLCDLKTLSAVVSRGLIVEDVADEHPTSSLAHPVYGEVIAARMTPTRVSVIKEQLAEAIEGSSPRRRADDLQAAVWRVEAGGDVRPDRLVAACRQCMDVLDFPLAERLAGAAVEAGGGVPASFALAEAVIGLGRADEGEKILRELELGAEDDNTRSAVAIQRARNLFWRLGRPAEAQDVVERIEKRLDDTQLRDEIAADRGTFLLFSGRTAAGNDLLESLMTRREVSADAKIRAAPPLVWGLSIAGRPDTAFQLVRSMKVETAEGASDDWFAPIWLDVNLGAAQLFAGRLNAAAAIAGPLYQKVVREGPELLRGVLAVATGLVARQQGKPASAARRLREAASYLRDNDFLSIITVALAELAHSLAVVGDVESAQMALSEAEDRASPSIRMGEAFMGLGRAWTSASRGEISAAIDTAFRTGESVRSLEHYGLEAMVLHDVVRLGNASMVVERLKQLGQEVEGDIVSIYSAHAMASDTADAPALEEASLAFERMGARLYAAESAAEASHCYRLSGRKTLALRAASRAQSLLGQCEGAMTPALADLEPLPITPREREVATMAARGANNREIAERLFLSVRTVHNHLHRVYKKLGVSGRSELSSVLDGRLHHENKP